MHFLLIYANSLKSNIEKVNFPVKFQVMGCSGQIMAGRGWSWVVVAKLWLVVGGDAKLVLVKVGRGWSHDLVMPFLQRNYRVHSTFQGYEISNYMLFTAEHRMNFKTPSIHNYSVFS